MTLTVVVIMFELTGALTYILPTMVSMAHNLIWHLLSCDPTRIDRLASD
jgi:H+/Cl- antiporter ClcA